MEYKWAIIWLIALVAMPMVGLALEGYNKAQVQIACYEAAKTNTNLNCEKDKK